MISHVIYLIKYIKKSPKKCSSAINFTKCSEAVVDGRTATSLPTAINRNKKSSAAGVLPIALTPLKNYTNLLKFALLEYLAFVSALSLDRTTIVDGIPYGKQVITKIKL